MQAIDILENLWEIVNEDQIGVDDDAEDQLLMRVRVLCEMGHSHFELGSSHYSQAVS